MKTSIIIASGIALMIYQNGQAQQETTTSKARIYVGDTYVGVGGYTIYSLDGSANDFRSLAPDLYDSERIPDNSAMSTSTTSTSGSFNMALGINFRNKDGEDRNQFQLRAGIHYVSGMASTTNWYSEEVIGTDTLYNQSGGASYEIDSVTSNSYGYSYNYDQIRLDFSAIYRTNQLSRWTAFAGVGLSMGASVKTRTYINDYEFTSIRVRNTNYNSPGFQNYENQVDTETNDVVKNKMVLGGLVYTTLGIDFRLGKTHPFWSKFHAGFELRPGISVIQSPEIGTIVNPAMSNSVTLRISV